MDELRGEVADLRSRLRLSTAENERLTLENEQLQESEADDIRLQMADLQASWAAEKAALEEQLSAATRDLATSRQRCGELEEASKAAADVQRRQRIRLREGEMRIEAMETEMTAASGKLEDAEGRANLLISEKASLESLVADLQKNGRISGRREKELQDMVEALQKELQSVRLQMDADAKLVADAKDAQALAMKAMEHASLHQDVMQKMRSRLTHIQSELIALSHLIRTTDDDTMEGVVQVLLDLANSCVQLCAYREDEINEALAATEGIIPPSRPLSPAPSHASSTSGHGASFDTPSVSSDKPLYTPWMREQVDQSGSPPYSVDSPLVGRILAEWSSVREKQQYLKLWLQCIVQNRRVPPKFPQGVHLIGLSPPTFESFMTVIAPLLANLPHAKVMIFTRRSSEGTFDVRIKVDRTPDAATSRMVTPERRSQSRAQGSTNGTPGKGRRRQAAQQDDPQRNLPSLGERIQMQLQKYQA
mmetsp:Transcript_9553/g.35771  ORF Transcript_9553/g.35771 Transcript_9553/m.35771 type:complete len:478 (-) Transcript_9553:543-1976(-)